MLTELAHEEDPTRLSTAAASIPEDHPANWQTQVSALNRYHGWYVGEPEDFARALDKLHATRPRACLGISEYGAGASIRQHEDPPHHPRHDGPWHPEEWQARVHEVHWQAMRARPWLWCKLIWNAFDFASDDRREGDAPGINDKGLVTGDRRVRKDAFYWYQSQWADEPMVYLASRRYTPRQQSAIRVRVYSNCASVELFVNDKPLGPRSDPHHDPLDWENITLQPGANRIRAVGTSAGRTVEDACVWEYAPGT